jgi:hypothetical protein
LFGKELNPARGAEDRLMDALSAVSAVARAETLLRPHVDFAAALFACAQN